MEYRTFSRGEKGKYENKNTSSYHDNFNVWWHI